MKNSTLLLSASVLVHLLIIDTVCYILSAEIPLNMLVISTYNIVWLILAIMVGTQMRNRKRIE